MLGVDELAAGRPPNTGLGQFAQYRIEEAFRALVEAEPLDGVLEDVGHECEDRPPVPRRAVRCSRFGHWVSVFEDQVVHDGDDGGLGLGTGHLAQSGHRRPQAFAWSAARAGTWDTS